MTTTHHHRLVILALALSWPLQSWAEKPTVSSLQAEAEKLQKKIDGDIGWLFRYQVEAGWYRSRLLSLQAQWKELLTKFGSPAARRRVVPSRTFAAPPARGFRIDEAVASEELSLEAARGAPGCASMRRCRLWLRVSFGRDYTSRNQRFEVAADFRAKGRRYAVPGKEFTVKQSVMTVDVALSRIYLPKGLATGTVKVFGNMDVRRKTFKLMKR